MNRESIHRGLGRRITALLVVLFLGLMIAACDTIGGGSDGEGAETSPPGREDDNGSRESGSEDRPGAANKE